MPYNQYHENNPICMHSYLNCILNLNWLYSMHITLCIFRQRPHMLITSKRVMLFFTGLHHLLIQVLLNFGMYLVRNYNYHCYKLSNPIIMVSYFLFYTVPKIFLNNYLSL